jgi:quercetin dioxygenase-like cupin family protein
MSTEPALDVFRLLASGLPEVSPPSSLRSRLLSGIEGRARYLPFAADLAAHFDLSYGAARELLLGIDGSGQWTQGVSPVLGFFHFRPGPRLATLRGGFVRMQAGAVFPLHRHRHRELTLVLEGQMVDGDGVRFEPGEALDMPEGSTHTLRVADGGPAMLALLHGAIEMVGQ